MAEIRLTGIQPPSRIIAAAEITHHVEPIGCKEVDGVEVALLDETAGLAIGGIALPLCAIDLRGCRQLRHCAPIRSVADAETAAGGAGRRA